VVFLARDQQLLNRAVVIKVLVAEHGDQRYDRWYLKKFKQEMEALARINHPGVVGVLDTGEMPDGKPFLIMQFVEGQTLRKVMIEQGMDFDRAANIVRQIGQALAAAHEKGVFHRDLKPENIMLEDLGRGREQVKLIDFGVARIKDSQVATDADVTWIAGTPPYMAPEQLRGKPIAESDVYGFGAVIYEMLTGQQPLKAGSAVDLYELQREGAIKGPKELRTNLPDAANAAILKALSFNSKDRYDSVQDFAEDLASALTGEARQSAPQPPAIRRDLITEVAEARPTAPDHTQFSEPPESQNAQAFRWGKWVAVIAVLLIAVTGWWWLTRKAKTTDFPPPAPVKSFSYWITVQKYRDKKPYQAPFKLAGEINFENDYHVRLNLNNRQPGHLYVVNEGPAPVNGLPSYVILFPSPTANNGSAQLAANQQIDIPERGDGFFFDNDQGTEKLWLIWSKNSLPALEAVKHLANSTDKGLISDSAHIQAIRDLIAQSRAAQPVKVEKDDAEIQSNVLGNGDVMVHLINLEHH
jgi:serine/threonine protein kinase